MFNIYTGGRSISSDPEKNVSWSKDGVPIVNTENKYLLKDNGRQLTIMNVLLRDSGVYNIEEVTANSRPLTTQLYLRVSCKCTILFSVLVL